MKALLTEGWRYLGVAALGLVVDFGTLLLLTECFEVSYLLSAACGFLAGLIVTFVLSEAFVFSAPRIGRTWIRFGIFSLIGLIGLALLTALMWVQVEVLGWNYVVGKVIATGIVYVWNFLARRSMYMSDHP